MAVQRTPHAVYDTKYHLVWAPKYRKWILRGDIQERVKGIFEEVSVNHGFEIDTMEVSGYVLSADNLEPVKGILVGLYSNQADSAFQKLPMLRVSRTDSRGHFIIKGVGGTAFGSL